MKITLQDQEKGAELFATLAQKAWESSTFKEQLVKNPVATIEQVTGKNLTLPDNKRIVVEDQTDESIVYLNIPAKVDFNDLELTDEQMEMVAGGDLVCAGIGFAVAIGVCWVVSKL